MDVWNQVETSFEIALKLNKLNSRIYLQPSNSDEIQ